MRLKQLFEMVSQLVTITFPAYPSLVYTMMLRPVGKDGADRIIYVGNCEVHDYSDPDVHHTLFVATVFRGDGTLYAANYWEKKADAILAANKAIASSRKVYGKGATKYETFTTYREGEVAVEGYNFIDNI